MPLHPHLAQVLKAGAAAPPYWTLPLPQARAAAAAAYPHREQPVEVGRVQDLQVPTPTHRIRARLYQPAGPGPHPPVVYLHGSGFTVLSIDTHDDLCRRLCRRSGAVVLSVDYRLAPEHPFPAAGDDAYAALAWADRNRATLGAAPRGLALAGDSAGACLALVAALRARDDGGPHVDAIAAWYPVTDHPDNEARASWSEFADGHGLSAQGMRWFWSQYLPRGTDAGDPRVSPLRADLRGLPPTWVTTAEYDVLRDEGEAFAQRLRAAGVPCELHRAVGMNHGFLKYADVLAPAAQAIDSAADWLAAQLRTASGNTLETA